MGTEASLPARLAAVARDSRFDSSRPHFPGLTVEDDFPGAAIPSGGIMAFIVEFNPFLGISCVSVVPLSSGGGLNDIDNVLLHK